MRNTERDREIRKRLAAGENRSGVARALGVSKNVVNGVAYRAVSAPTDLAPRASPLRSPVTPVLPGVFEVAPQGYLRRKLRLEAKRREMTLSELGTMILEYVARDNLFAAVIDE